MARHSRSDIVRWSFRRAMVYALSLANGKVASGWPVDVQAGPLIKLSRHALCALPYLPCGGSFGKQRLADAFKGHAAALAKIGKTFLSENQNQRGALTLLNGILYVPYGGATMPDASLWSQAQLWCKPVDAFAS